jgi:ADP-dependent NAD(P)H-hydrate dehydratase
MSEPDLITPELLRGWALPDPAGSKQARGRVLVVGGAAGSPGGVALAGLAALRVGAGKVQLALAASVAPAIAAAFPEAGVIALAETGSGSIRGAAAAEACAEAVASADAVLIGPGLDDADEADALLRGLLPSVDAETPLTLDAYALGALPGLTDLDGGARGRSLAPVLTPNAEELGRLLDREVDPDQRAVLEAAESYDACVTAQTLIADRDARSWRVPSGHPGLATAGSGDVLAGLVVGLLAREASPAQAACWGTYLHSVAGERLASSVGGVGFLARELVDQVPPVLAELS